MWTDPIVKEIRKQRNLYASEHNYDIDAIFQDVLRLEKLSTKKIVTMPARKVIPVEDCKNCQDQ